MPRREEGPDAFARAGAQSLNRGGEIALQLDARNRAVERDARDFDYGVSRDEIADQRFDLKEQERALEEQQKTQSDATKAKTIERVSNGMAELYAVDPKTPGARDEIKRISSQYKFEASVHPGFAAQIAHNLNANSGWSEGQAEIAAAKSERATKLAAAKEGKMSPTGMTIDGVQYSAKDADRPAFEKDRSFYSGQVNAAKRRLDLATKNFDETAKADAAADVAAFTERLASVESARNVPGAAPAEGGFKTPSDVKAAFKAGSIPREKAEELLRSQFGHQ